MPNGILVIDKPAGWTSMDVCAKLRGILKERRVGHGGTLDPMATGVLPVFVGTATRGVEFAEKGRKEYDAHLRLGLVTNTQDTTGETLETHPTDGIRFEDLLNVLPRFTGEIQQVPPMFSAIKRDGKKLYELARAGKEVRREPRPVTIYALEARGVTPQGDFFLHVRCSKGTYIRTLCHDIGQALGCGGCLSALRRTMAAGFTLEQAVTLDKVQEKGESLLLPVDTLFTAYPACTLTSPKLEARCRNGRELPMPDLAPGTYRVYGANGAFLCLSRWENGTLTAIKNFFPT